MVLDMRPIQIVGFATNCAALAAGETCRKSLASRLFTVFPPFSRYSGVLNNLWAGVQSLYCMARPRGVEPLLRG